MFGIAIAQSKLPVSMMEKGSTAARICSRMKILPPFFRSVLCTFRAAVTYLGESSHASIGVSES